MEQTYDTPKDTHLKGVKNFRCAACHRDGVLIDLPDVVIAGLRCSVDCPNCHRRFKYVSFTRVTADGFQVRWYDEFGG